MKKNAKIILVFYAVLLISASTLSTHALAGDLLYSKGFTQSQRVQVKDCYKRDITFPSQVNKLTSEGDIALTGMYKQRDGYMFMTMTNAYGKWMNYSPLHCDLRTKEKKEADRRLKQNQEKKRAIQIKQEQLAKQDKDREKALQAKLVAEKKVQKEKEFREKRA